MITFITDINTDARMHNTRASVYSYLKSEISGALDEKYIINSTPINENSMFSTSKPLSVSLSIM